MVDDTDTLKRNIAARKNAEEAIASLKGYLVGVCEERFWECLAIMAAARIGKVLGDDGPCRFPMTDDEALRFENTTVPRGIHRGFLVGRVAPDYWAALAEDGFSKQLRRYVQSDHFRRKVGLMSENISTLRGRKPDKAKEEEPPKRKDYRDGSYLRGVRRDVH